MKIHITNWQKIFGVDGIVFGSHVFVTEQASKIPSFMKHEEMHTIQYNRYGFLGFLARYAWSHIRYGYKNNPLETEARRYAGEV